MAYIPSKSLTVTVVLKHETFIPANRKGGTDARNGQIGIFEQGTQSGQPTLVVCLETERGENIFHEITGNQFEMLVAAYIGAKERFAERIKMN